MRVSFELSVRMCGVCAWCVQQRVWSERVRVCVFVRCVCVRATPGVCVVCVLV